MEEVVIIRRRSRRSAGMPWGLLASLSSDPLTLVMPRLLAKTIKGAIFLFQARFKKEKHSKSSKWTSSMNKTPGTISAFTIPLSIQLLLIDLITDFRFDFTGISEKRAKKPWVRLLMTSISCKFTTWTSVRFFCNSPSDRLQIWPQGPWHQNHEHGCKIDQV